MNLAEDEARSRFAAAAVARLATVDAHGRPHVVPVTFAAAGDGIVTAVDHKPKRGNDLARLRNLRHQPRVSVLVDHYEARWEALWWVRADGAARVLGTDDEPECTAALNRLAAKYPQYGVQRPAGPVILIDVDRWTGWAWTDPATG